MYAGMMKMYLAFVTVFIPQIWFQFTSEWEQNWDNFLGHVAGNTHHLRRMLFEVFR